jgi:hypothetical protein
MQFHGYGAPTALVVFTRAEAQQIIAASHYATPDLDAWLAGARRALLVEFLAHVERAAGDEITTDLGAEDLEVLVRVARLPGVDEALRAGLEVVLDGLRRQVRLFETAVEVLHGNGPPEIIGPNGAPIESLNIPLQTPAGEVGIIVPVDDVDPDRRIQLELELRAAIAPYQNKRVSDSWNAELEAVVEKVLARFRTRPG